MKVIFSVVGQIKPMYFEPMELGAVPREGEIVTVYHEGEEIELTVRTVIWILEKDNPHVYIVIGPPRPY